jgi:hypothetical protein
MYVGNVAFERLKETKPLLIAVDKVLMHKVA